MLCVHASPAGSLVELEHERRGQQDADQPRYQPEPRTKLVEPVEPLKEGLGLQRAGRRQRLRVGGTRRQSHAVEHRVHVRASEQQQRRERSQHPGEQRVLRAPLSPHQPGHALTASDSGAAVGSSAR